MQAWLRCCLLACLTAAAAAAFAPARAAEPVELRWWQLAPMPPDLARALLAKISTQRRLTPRTDACVKPSTDLMSVYDGERVRLSGMPVPLAGQEGPRKSFLLIPFAGGCANFPPPRNQMILVTPAGVTGLDRFEDPVEVVGVLRTLPAETEIGEAGYRLAAEVVELQR